MSSPTEIYGWEAVPRNRSNVPTDELSETNAVKLDFSNIWPSTHIVHEARQHIENELPAETFNHSLRVYNYGHTIVLQHFPEWIKSNADTFFETWALTCLFHDIGTTQANRDATLMSFEFQGGLMALELLQKFGAPKAQAESVCEAIIRHQDPGETGTISRMGQLVQLATEFDNMGWQPHLVHKDVIEQVVARYPRKEWSSCFSATIRKEIDAKPWCHTTALDGFAEAVEGNQLMQPYDSSA